MQQPVLNYHAVGSPSSPTFAEWVVDRTTLAVHLDLLADRGLQGTTMADALADPQPDQVALTFDDGYEDFATEAVPELEARGFGATVFVATAHVGARAAWLAGEGAGDRKMASWDQLRDVESRGFEIGSHSHTHPQLDLLPDDELHHEIVRSRQVLHDQLGHDVSGFCYPHGFHGTRVRGAVVNAGFEYACGVKHKLGSIGQDRFSIARIVVRRDDTVSQVARWLDGHDLRRGGPLVERSLATGFRMYRKLRHSG